VALSPLPWRRIPRDSLEISDLLAAFDPGGTRAPLARAGILATLERSGNDVAADIVRKLPHADGRIDAGAADRALVEAHVELQRLSEEFDHGRRVREVLLPMLQAARLAGGSWARRVTDMGCGLAYVPRYLAHHRALDPNVVLAGRDWNPVLIEHARALAREEGLTVDLAVGNATTGDAPPGILVSTGVLHHIPEAHLEPFFTTQRAHAWGFVHFDFQPSPLAPFGAWLFHRARFRSALARHDGVLSAERAHPAKTLLEAAADPDGAWSVALFGAKLGPFPRVFHAIVGVRDELRGAFESALGARVGRLGPWL
jgi:hypothetical protein